MTLQLLAVCAITFLFKDSYIFAKIRNKLIAINVFFLELFECSFCLGFHSSWMVYLLSTQYSLWTINNIILFGFAGAATSLLYYKVLEHLSK
jgi:hypothetical protein